MRSHVIYATDMITHTLHKVLRVTLHWWGVPFEFEGAKDKFIQLFFHVLLKLVIGVLVSKLME